uniref:Uncharacterized protein n=1 Tax=Heterorhabditis bacteriophora TaxID=37862 RepID=A0A1I7WJI2_HETBA
MSYKEYILVNKLQLQYVHRVRAQYTRMSPLTPPRATAGLETQGRLEIYMTVSMNQIRITIGKTNLSHDGLNPWRSKIIPKLSGLKGSIGHAFAVCTRTE